MDKTSKPQSIDEYLAPLSAEQRETLETLRRNIRSLVPDATECICYGVPGFRLDGKLLVSFGPAAKYCSFYPGALPVREHADELKAYPTSKGTIRFPIGEPLPSDLVAKLVNTRIAEHAADKAKKLATKKV